MMMKMNHEMKSFNLHKIEMIKKLGLKAKNFIFINREKNINKKLMEK